MLRKLLAFTLAGVILLCLGTTVFSMSEEKRGLPDVWYAVNQFDRFGNLEWGGSGNFIGCWIDMLDDAIFFLEDSNYYSGGIRLVDTQNPDQMLRVRRLPNTSVTDITTTLNHLGYGYANFTHLVNSAQWSLFYKGYLALGDISAEWDYNTYSAVLDFQQEGTSPNGSLPVTGVVESETWYCLATCNYW